jgi:AraC-like DNA-binding protein
MGERTLHRRLSAEGTSFRQLLQRHRQQLASLLLETTMMTMREIALTLNYTSEAAFNRAYRRWTGVSPAKWRHQNTVT